MFHGKDQIWMKVTMDEYELPVAVANTAAELARILGVSEGSMRSWIYRARRDGYKCCYVCVKIEEDD